MPVKVVFETILDEELYGDEETLTSMSDREILELIYEDFQAFLDECYPGKVIRL